MSDRTAPNSNFEVLGKEQPIEPGSMDDTELREDQAIHLLLTAWTQILEEEQQRPHRTAAKP